MKTAELTEIRNELYNALPTGQIDAFELTKVISEHLKKLDKFIDESSQPMSAEQVEEQFKFLLYFLKEVDLDLFNNQQEFHKKVVFKHWLKLFQSTAPTVKAEGWVSVEDRLPEPLETVWLSNGKGFTSLGCRTELVDVGDDTYNWCWAQSNGIIYEEKGKIVSECEDDDLDVKFWHPLPSPPTVNIN